jgi:phosphoribosylglycinamide formyltransferase 1
VARLAVLASGDGSNFEAIAMRVASTRHELVCLICDKPDAGVLRRAARLGVPSDLVVYERGKRDAAEDEIIGILESKRADVVALAGFMRLLSPRVVDSFPESIVNIHPSLLPKYPGMHAIEESFVAGDCEVGITIHIVDHGMDSGPIIRQEVYRRSGRETLGELTEAIHRLEHAAYPEVIVDRLNRVDALDHHGRGGGPVSRPNS